MIYMKNARYSQNKPGFTIVELLIVIVVIAILAAITIVAFSGVQSRARESAMLAAVDSYEKAFRLYYTEHNTFPIDAGAFVGGVCLGDRSSYKTVAPFAEGTCAAGSSLTQGHIDAYYSSNDTVNSQLGTVMGRLPDVSQYVVKLTEGISVRGFQYTGSTTYFGDGRIVHTGYIVYFIDGDKNCGRGEKELLDTGELVGAPATGIKVSRCQVKIEV